MFLFTVQTIVREKNKHFDNCTLLDPDQVISTNPDPDPSLDKNWIRNAVK